MDVVTDSTPLEEPKNADICNVFKLYKLLATEEQTAAKLGAWLFLFSLPFRVLNPATLLCRTPLLYRSAPIRIVEVYLD